MPPWLAQWIPFAAGTKDEVEAKETATGIPEMRKPDGWETGEMR